MAKFANQTVLNMQNRIITSIFCATLTIAAMAQTETPDSIKTQNLDEIVVEAQMQRTSPTSTTFIPTVKQKNASQNAVDLLRQMAMPQIQINPVSEAVTDNAGRSSYFYKLPRSKVQRGNEVGEQSGANSAIMK